MLPSTHFPFVVTIAGVPLTELEARDIEEITVNSNLHMPNMFVLRMRDEDPLGAELAVAFKYLDNPRYTTLGAPVTIAAIPISETALPVPQVIFTGEITAVEAEFDSGRATLIIRGYDKSHRLNMGKKTATYMMMPDVAIVTAVAGAAGVPCTPTFPGATPREYVLQNNQTDMEFLREIARRNGCHVYTDQLGIMHVKPFPAPGVGVPVLLQLKRDLYSFNPRVSVANQVLSVLVQAWDAKVKIGMTMPGIPIPAVQGGPGIARHLLAAKAIAATAKEVIVDEPSGNPAAEITALAQGLASDVAHRFLQADGECRGNPGVLAGITVTILGAGATYSGPYQVSSATHSYVAGNYTTSFSVTGADPDTVGDLVDKHADERPGRIYGVVVGQVVDNVSDPLQLGRVKVKLPHLGNLPPIVSNYCRPIAPWGGLKAGIYAIPQINDEVLVAFEHGDPNLPYIVGHVWGLTQMPPAPNATGALGGKPTKHVLRTRMGHEILLDDTPGKYGITVTDYTMMNSVAIDSVKNALAIKVLGDVTIDCLNFKVKANAMMNLEGTKVDVKAAALLNMESNGIVKVKSATMLKLDGAAVQIKANTMLKLDGLTVNVNNGALEVM
jgi:hypothetical protein